MSESEKPLAGRLALVTGSSRGIGRGIALGLAADGADVAINYRRDEAAALETVEAAKQFGVKARAFQASVDDFEALETMVEAIGDWAGPTSILVNNAGIASRGSSVEHTEAAELERVMRVHALAPHRLTQLLIPALRQGARGDVIMISSVATLGHSAQGGPYNMAKAAMEALAWTLAKELRTDDIHVNIVAPGLVETEMGRRLMKARTGVDSLRELDATMPFERVCQPEDIANAVRFLVSNAASYITGEKINVHGGG